MICNKCNIEKTNIEFSRGNSPTGLSYTCKDCMKKYYRENKEKIKTKQKKYKEDNKVIISEYQKTYQQQYKRKNYKKYKRDYYKNKLSKNPVEKLKTYLRNRVYSILKNSKDKNTEELLGASFEKVKLHIESTFQEGMSWENYGDWHVDHKIPLASASTKEEVEKLFHYTNLQALWASENLSKGVKILLK